MSNSITAYKGFDANLQCRDYQFAVGKAFEQTGKIEVCGNGFHACAHPLDILAYYPPAGSRFARVVLSGSLDMKTDGDTKIAGAIISIEAEIELGELITAAVEHVFDAAKWLKSKTTTRARAGVAATGGGGAATATGYRGVASATGDRGAALATGDRGAATAAGYIGVASATGYIGVASATGDIGAASATGDRGAATATGYRGAASGAIGNALFLVERDNNWKIIATWSGIVGKKRIKPDTFYTLTGGKPVEAAA